MIIYQFDEKVFSWSNHKFPIITSSSSLDAVNRVQQGKYNGNFHFRIIVKPWIIDIEGALDVLRHCKMMGIGPVSIALPLSLSPILLAEKIGCACIEIQCAVAGIEEGLQRIEILRYIVNHTKIPLVFWGVNDFTPPFENSRIIFERQIFPSISSAIR